MAEIVQPRSQEPKARLSSFFTNTVNATCLAFTDSQIDEIAHLLSLIGEPGRAATYPRTYIVLRSIGSLELFDELLQQGFDDICFPVDARGLPPSFTPRVRSAFVQAQSLVLTRSLDLEHGRHRHFLPNEPLPFDIKHRLGSGGYSQVDKVQSRISFRYYALKRIRRRRAFGNDTKDGVKMFLSEVRIIKSVNHEHIVKFVGSYTDKSYLGILLLPVAEMDLNKYLGNLCSRIKESSSSMTNIELGSSLRTFFGCLTAGLAFLHESRIRHKDIKPQNILIAQGRVMFTDFGLSRYFADGEGSTTSGMTAATPRYCPPEVVAYESRNTSADIWSLGCVFLEMAAALLGSSIEDIKAVFLDIGTGEPHYSSNLPACSKIINDMHTKAFESDGKIWTVIRAMLNTDRTLRPTAAFVLMDLTATTCLEGFDTTFCGICCLPGEDSESHDSLAEDVTVSPLSQYQATVEEHSEGSNESHMEELVGEEKGVAVEMPTPAPVRFLGISQPEAQTYDPSSFVTINPMEAEGRIQDPDTASSIPDATSVLRNSANQSLKGSQPSGPSINDYLVSDAPSTPYRALIPLQAFQQYSRTLMKDHRNPTAAISIANSVGSPPPPPPPPPPTLPVPILPSLPPSLLLLSDLAISARSTGVVVSFRVGGWDKRLKGIVPRVVDECCKQLKRNGLSTKNVFGPWDNLSERPLGPMTDIMLLHSKLNTSFPLGDPKATVFQYATLLQAYLVSLPNRLFPYRILEDMRDYRRRHDEQLRTYKSVPSIHRLSLDRDWKTSIRPIIPSILELPDPEFFVLLCLLKLFKAFIQNASKNRTSTSFFAERFFPWIFWRYRRSRNAALDMKLLEQLIDQQDQLFNDPRIRQKSFS